MVNIFKKLELSAYLELFSKEKIKPDILPKLFLTNFPSLGITNRQSIMNLGKMYGTFIPGEFQIETEKLLSSINHMKY